MYVPQCDRREVSVSGIHIAKNLCALLKSWEFILRLLMGNQKKRFEHGSNIILFAAHYFLHSSKSDFMLSSILALGAVLFIFCTFLIKASKKKNNDNWDKMTFY
jgi:hypothetical protein